MNKKAQRIDDHHAEDFAPTGFTAADLKKGGKASDQWPDIEKNLVEIATKENLD
jgi:hypothetical protein